MAYHFSSYDMLFNVHSGAVMSMLKLKLDSTRNTCVTNGGHCTEAWTSLGKYVGAQLAMSHEGKIAKLQCINNDTEWCVHMAWIHSVRVKDRRSSKTGTQAR